MSQSIEVGSILGGRYQVTEFVMTSAESDLVLEGIDQVLNRSVSILVASAENSSQLASNAREIAMDERSANVQVLDLGITDANQSYLVANLTNSADLLDLIIGHDAPYVEPFYTDTLGTEIFGESREAVPQTYDDDDEYYEQLRYDAVDEEQEPREAPRASRLGGLKNRFSRKNQEQPTESEDVNEEQLVEEDAEPQTAPNAVTQATPVAPAAKSTAKPKVTKLDDEPSVTATAALSSAELSKGNEKPKKEAPAAKAAAAGTAASTKPAQPAKTPAKGETSAPATPNGSKPKTFPAAAKTVPAAAPGADQQDVNEEESNAKGPRLLVGAVLIAVLVIGVVFAFNFLGGSDDAPIAQTPTENSQTENGGTPTESDSPEPSSDLPTPVVAEVSRLVPGNQSLNNETDDTLPRMIDGNPANAYSTYSFTTSNFGGFASNMVFILELEETSKISEISLEGLNASGGSYEILVGESDDLGAATAVANGSFTGPSLSVPVSEDQATGQYVFLNVTDLPRRASGANPSRPFGLQIGEFSVK